MLNPGQSWTRRLSPLARINQVVETTIQQALIEVFNQWGVPASIRVDNGAPLGAPKQDHIPPLALWLIGLGIDVIFNRPGRPTDNAVVERMQQTTKNWAEVSNAPNFNQLTTKLKKVHFMQRESYRVRRLDHKTRLEAFPELTQNRRKYTQQLFCWTRVMKKLAQYTFVRKVSKIGQFILYGQRYSIGQKLKRQYVTIQLDAQQILWHIFDASGHFIDALPAKNFEPHHIYNLTVCQRINSA